MGENTSLEKNGQFSIFECTLIEYFPDVLIQEESLGNEMVLFSQMNMGAFSGGEKNIW